MSGSVISSPHSGAHIRIHSEGPIVVQDRVSGPGQRIGSDSNQPVTTKSITSRSEQVLNRSPPLKPPIPSGAYRNHHRQRRQASALPLKAPSSESVKNPIQKACRADSEPAPVVTKLARSPRRPKYKPYSLKDYRQLPEDVQLGKLGPDLDNEELAAKKRAYYRMLEFARAQRLINLSLINVCAHQALDFAARITPPKPPAKRRPVKAKRSAGPCPVPDEIVQLTQQHERGRNQVEAIRRELCLSREPRR